MPRYVRHDDRTENDRMVSQFAMRLAFGLSVLWAVLPREQISAGFFRIQCLVVLGLSVLAAVAFGAAETPGIRWAWWWPSTARSLAAGVAMFAFVGSVLWTLQRRRGGTVCGGCVLLMAGGWLLLRVWAVDASVPVAVVALAINELLSGVLLGGCVGSMLLGHWYLTAPAMSHRPLFRAVFVVGVAAVLRLVFGICAAAAAPQAIRHAVLAGAPSARTVWLGLHWLPGIVGPLLTALLAWRIMQAHRNTQAATGVLFVAVICSFLGEMSGLLLQRELGWPL